MTTIDDIIRQFNTHDWIPEAGRMAVLFIDLQEYFRGMIHPILENIVSLVSVARKHHIPLFFTQHGHEAKADQGMLGRWWGDLIIKGSNEASLLPELRIAKEDHIIHKNTYSAFFGTDLETRLKDQGITDVIIGGVMTNLCCETSARDAFVRDFRVFFLADGTSTVSEDFHLSTLKNLAYGFATLMSCHQLVQSIKAK